MIHYSDVKHRCIKWAKWYKFTSIIKILKASTHIAFFIYWSFVCIYMYIYIFICRMLTLMCFISFWMCLSLLCFFKDVAGNVWCSRWLSLSCVLLRQCGFWLFRLLLRLEFSGLCHFYKRYASSVEWCCLSHVWFVAIFTIHWWPVIRLHLSILQTAATIMNCLKIVRNNVDVYRRVLCVTGHKVVKRVF